MVDPLQLHDEPPPKATHAPPLNATCTPSKCNANPLQMQRAPPPKAMRTPSESQGLPKIMAVITSHSGVGFKKEGESTEEKVKGD